jgi:hypothetical protein
LLFRCQVSLVSGCSYGVHCTFATFIHRCS